MFFSGSQTLNINAGGRIAIPTRYRDDLVSEEDDGKLFLTSHLYEKCLVLYPKAKFEDVARQISEIEDTAQAETFDKIIICQAVETEMDGQGRIMIPPALRDIAGIDKEVTFVGKRDSFQLWDSRSWKDDIYESKEQAKNLVQSGQVNIKL